MGVGCPPVPPPARVGAPSVRALHFRAGVITHGPGVLQCVSHERAISHRVHGPA